MIFFITAVYCLLERKTTSIYEKMFKIIIDKCEEQNLFPDPRFLHVDFEKAVITSASNIFGSELEIRGCFYHLCQSTFRKIQDLGLQTAYMNDDKFSHFCSMIDSLAFLPLERVHEGMDFLKQTSYSEANELLSYFDTTYVNGSYKRVGAGMNIKLRKINPLFLPKTWNVFEATLNSEHRTNNICESWNNRFTHLVGHSHPTIWVLIKKIKLEIGADRAKIALSSTGQTIKKIKINQKNIRLKTLCERINNFELSVEEFLTQVGNNIRTRPRL